MKKKYAMTLFEIMIVIFIIGIIGSVVSYNMKGSLDKGRAFKTTEGLNKIYDIVQLEDPDKTQLLSSKDTTIIISDILLNSGFVKNPGELMKDGWGIPYTFTIVNNDISTTSARYETYCNNKGKSISYPWN